MPSPVYAFHPQPCLASTHIVPLESQQVPSHNWVRNGRIAVIRGFAYKTYVIFCLVWWTSSSTTFCPVKLWSCGVDQWADADEYDRCLSMFRYIGIKQATFAPLGSLGNRSSDSFGSSPKSMYRLAHMVRKLSYGAQINIRQLKPTPLHCSLKYPKHEISPWRI